MRYSRVFQSLFTTFVCLLAVAVSAEAESVSYQGVLTNAGGDSLLNGQFDIAFSIFAAPSGGGALWTESHVNTQVNNGVYTLQLGSITPLPDPIGAGRWLEISVEGTTLTPRLPITADFRALESRRAENADSVNHIRASATPQPGQLLPLGANAKFPLNALPNIVSSVDSVTNHGGNIDLIAGQNISIVPNDSANTISISAASGNVYSGGQCIQVTPNRNINLDLGFQSNSRCLAVNYDSLNCMVTYDLNLDIAGSECIDVDYDSAACRYTIESLLDLAAGPCITIQQVAGNCQFTIGVDPDCLDSLVIEHLDTLHITADSIFHSEVYAKSFVITQDGTTGNAVGHLTSDGRLELFGSGDTLRLGPHGTMDIIHGGVRVGGITSQGEIQAHSFEVIDSSGHIVAQLTSDGSFSSVRDVAGTSGHEFNSDGTWNAVHNGHVVARLDTSGEIGARSFYVEDEHGNTLVHLTQNGRIIVGNDTNLVVIRPNSIGVSDDLGLGGHTFSSDGTWKAYRGIEQVAGLDTNGEIHARSFYTLNQAGDTVIHLTSTGQVLVNGVPVTGEGEIITRTAGLNSASHTAYGYTLIGPTGAANLDQTGLNLTGTQSGVQLRPNGTWDATQNSQTVAGLTNAGEIFAKSFELRESASGPLLGHMYIENGVGKFSAPNGAISSGTIFGASTVYSSSVSGNTQLASDMTPGYMRTLTLISSVQTAGHTFLNNGSWTARQNSVNVAGLTTAGEIQAKSFEVRDSAGGAIKAHLTNDANLDLTGTLTGGGEIETTAPAAGGHTNVGMLTPTKMCVNNMNASTNSGWMFYADGTSTQYVDPPGAAPPVLNTYTTSDGYTVFPMPAFFGNQLNFNYLSGGNVAQGIIVSGNMTVNGKLNVVGAVDPIIAEVFPARPSDSFLPGTVVVADTASDYVIPCYAAAQSSVVGVVTPNEKVDEKGNISVTILGFAASLRTDGSRLEVRVKADASFAPIRRGDLLTTSPTVGYAMKATNPKTGTIVGKALENLSAGTGEIKVLVTLL